MIALLGAVVVASVLGSLHCAGMCGGIVALYSSAFSGRGWMGHAVYSMGRLLAYTTLGAIAGLLGAGLDVSAEVAGLQRASALLAGVAVILIAARGFLPFPRLSTRLPRPLSRIIADTSRRLREASPVVRAGALGVLSGILPCGWLYAFVATAAGTGSALAGAAVLAVFWLGTVPMLVLIGLGAQRVILPFSRRAPGFVAVALVSVALVTILGRGSLAGNLKAAIPSGASEGGQERLVEHVEHLDSTRAPCCDDGQ